jgi:hypothetical protein
MVSKRTEENRAHKHRDSIFQTRDGQTTVPKIFNLACGSTKILIKRNFIIATGEV